METANEDHQRIVDAYRARDEDNAVAHTEHHLRSTLEAVESFERDRAGTDGAAAAAPLEPAA
jgi:DNA-binding GntR family transcriptional regulator